MNILFDFYMYLINLPASDFGCYYKAMMGGGGGGLGGGVRLVHKRSSILNFSCY